MSSVPSRFLAPLISPALGTVGALLVGAVGPAAAVPVCGPGDNWVDTCAPGVTVFPTFADLELQFSFPGQPSQIVNFSYQSQVDLTHYAPVDALPPYPNAEPNWTSLGSVGVNDGNLGVIPFSFAKTLTNTLPGVGAVTINGQGYGAIVEATESGINRPDLAWAFLTVFAEIDTPWGKAKNTTAIVSYGVKWLPGISPLDVPLVSPPPALPAPPESAWEDLLFFAVNDNGDFIDSNGNVTTDPTQFLNTITVLRQAPVAVPEPLTVAGALTAVGLGWKFKRRRDDATPVKRRSVSLASDRPG